MKRVVCSSGEGQIKGREGQLLSPLGGRSGRGKWHYRIIEGLKGGPSLVLHYAERY